MLKFTKYNNNLYKCSNDFFMNINYFKKKHESLTNSNMVNYDFSNSSSIHYVIEQNKVGR
jgi:negative regulator of genetic competence, sporulation and motility